VWLETIPLTPNGKIDHKALPKPDEVRPKLETAYVAPRTQIEETIARIWRQILRIEKVGVQDNFFDLGGNSLLLMQTHAKLCLALEVDFPIVRFFEHSTIAALTEFLAARNNASLPNVHERAARQRAAFARRQNQTMTT
jgi:acyl carrier protein